MEMVRHDYKIVEQISAAVAIVEKSVCEDFGCFWDLEDSAALPAFCGDKVGDAWGCSMSWRCHL